MVNLLDNRWLIFLIVGEPITFLTSSFAFCIALGGMKRDSDPPAV